MRTFLQGNKNIVIGLPFLMLLGGFLGCGVTTRTTTSALTIINPDAVVVASSEPSSLSRTSYDVSMNSTAGFAPDSDSYTDSEPVQAHLVNASLVMHRRDESDLSISSDEIAENELVREHEPPMEPSPALIGRPEPMPIHLKVLEPKPVQENSHLATIEIGSTKGRAISPTFMGLSHEWGTQAQMGTKATGVDTIYRQLLKNLMAYGSGPLILRIGGNSTDKTGEPTATTVTAFAELAKAINVRFTLGVNLGSDNVKLAVDQAKAYVSQMPAGSLQAIEIGNEPDGYVYNKIRPAPYTFQNYLADFNTWKTHILPVLPSTTSLMGPAWCCLGSLKNIQAYDSSESLEIGVFSQHNYVGNAKNITQEDYLLLPSAATSGAQAVAAAVSATHTLGVPFRMGEMNSLAGGGSKGVSDSFQSALWAIDTMFEYVNVGVDGVNWHGNPSAGSYYNMIIIASRKNGSITSFSLAEVRPLYYGLLLFQQATGNKAHLLPIKLSTSANLKAWATVDASGTPRLVIINKDKTRAGSVSVSMPGYKHAQLTSLTAPSYLSMTGVTLAGQTFDGSTDGTIQGTKSVDSFGSTDGVFKIPLTVTSAALVVFSK